MILGSNVFPRHREPTGERIDDRVRGLGIVGIHSLDSMVDRYSTLSSQQWILDYLKIKTRREISEDLIKSWRY